MQVWKGILLPASHVTLIKSFNFFLNWFANICKTWKTVSFSSISLRFRINVCPAPSSTSDSVNGLVKGLHYACFFSPLPVKHEGWVRWHLSTFWSLTSLGATLALGATFWVGCVQAAWKILHLEKGSLDWGEMWKLRTKQGTEAITTKGASVRM